MKVKPKKIPTITEEEEQRFRAESESAKKLLESEEFKFFRDYLVKEKEQVIEDAVNNRLKKTVIIQKDKEIIYERWEQEAEATGKFKFIFKFITHLQNLVKIPGNIEKAKSEGRLKIE
jgi:peroxiredoxin